VEDWADVRPLVESVGEAAGQGESRGHWGSRGTRCGRRVASDGRWFDFAAAATTRAPWVKIGKRQAGLLAQCAAANVDAFYAERRPGPALMSTCWC
jgi:hypothetical protein